VGNVGDSYRDYTLEVFRGSEGVHERVSYPVLADPPSLYADFATAVATGAAPLCPGSQAAVVARLIDRIYATAAR
jgi:predicted dehydrogenase